MLWSTAQHHVTRERQFVSQRLFSSVGTKRGASFILLLQISVSESSSIWSSRTHLSRTMQRQFAKRWNLRYLEPSAPAIHTVERITQAWVCSSQVVSCAAFMRICISCPGLVWFTYP